jgi:hypothetical protein
MKRNHGIPVVVATGVLLLACMAKPATPMPSQDTQSSGSSDNSLKKENLAYADRVAWYSRLKWPQDCESMFDYPDKSLSGLTFYSLSDKRFLVQITCTLGSYQGTYSFVLLDESVSPSKSAVLSFTTFEDSGESGPNRLQKTQATELTGTPDFDRGTQGLRVVNKFRGLGDCGFLTVYDFSKGQADLMRVQGKLSCDGKGPFDPKDWKNIPIK